MNTQRQRTSTDSIGRSRVVSRKTDSLLRNLESDGSDSHITGERTALLAHHPIRPVSFRGEGSQHNLLTNSTFVESEEIPPTLWNDEERAASSRQDSINSLILRDSEEYYDNLPRRRITCEQILYSRRPTGKAVPLVLFIYFLESFAFFTILNAVRWFILNVGHNETWSNFMYVFFYSSAGRVLYPIAGFIADAFLGRYKVIHIGLWLFWALFVILSISLAVDITSNGIKITIFILTAVLFSAATGSIEANIIPFGADQISQGATSSEFSSYFYWHYFARNAGSLANTIVSLLVFDIGRHHDTLSLILPMIGILCVSLALILHYCFKHLYYHEIRENPLKLVINVIHFAATVKRQPPRFRRAFRIGESKKPRIELAKIDYDGIFTSEEVENVKTFCRILLIIYSLGGCFIAYGATYTMFTYQLTGLASNITDLSQYGFLSRNLFQLINATSILIALPILNHIILVCLPNTNIRVRLGLGVFFVCLSAVLGGFLQWSFNFRHIENVNYTEQLLWLVLPSIVDSIGEMLVFVTALEFIYAQSPNNMKGMLSGLLYLALGIFGGVGNVFFYEYPVTEHSITSALAWFHFIFALVGSVGIVMYALVACLYRNRERPVNDESEGEAARRIVAQRVYSS